MKVSRARIAAGALIWAAAAFLLRARLADPVEGRDARALASVQSYLLARRVPIVIRFREEVAVGVGDLVYHRGREGSLVQVGEVTALVAGGRTLPALRAIPGDGVNEVRCEVRAAPGGSPGGGGELRARLVSVPQTASWVLRTLLPPEKLALIAEEWNAALVGQREEIFAILSPLLRDLIVDVEEVLSADLPTAFEAHRAELGEIGRRLQKDVIHDELGPLIDTELWPIIRERARPTLDAIAAEIWERLPLWSFTWRIIYQSLPLTSRGRLKPELERFFREETIPVLKAHARDFLGVFEDIASEAASNPHVGAAFRRSFDRILHDRGLQHEIRLVFQDVVLDNPRFHQKMLERWSRPEVGRALEKLSARLEPLLRRIGDIVLGTQGGPVTPEFARVLRTQVLKKDQRWILIEAAEGFPAEPGLRLASGAVVPGEVERP